MRHQLQEAEVRVNQLQALMVGMSQEMGVMGDVIQVQNNMFNVQQALLLEVEKK